LTKRSRDPAEGGALSSADNVLRLLLLFRRGRPIRVLDAAAELGVAPSTAHRLLATLQKRGFVQQDRRTRAYLIGDILLDIIRSTPQSWELEALATPILREVVSRLRETCHIAVLQGPTVAYVAGIESTETLRTGLHIGMTFPANATAAGKILLAYLPPNELRTLYSHEELVRLRKSTIGSWSALWSEVQLARRRGFATNIEESEVGVHAVSVPIGADSLRPYAAIVLTAPSSRLGRRKMSEVARELKVLANIVHARLQAAGIVKTV
jgi:DNA-binding IclR family transcriptional regulator